MKVLRDMAEAVKDNWDNYLPEEQVEIEAIVEAFETWAKEVGSVHVADACAGLKPFLP